MRNLGEFIVDVAKKPPLLFPLVGLFHLFWLGWTIWSDRCVPFPDLVWLEVLRMLGYTVFWIWASDLRRTGATGYISLAVLDLITYLGARNNVVSEIYVSNIFPIDVLLSLALLYYYKKFK